MREEGEGVVSTNKGGRTATGTIDFRPNPKNAGKPQWMVRLTLPGNKRSPWIELDPSIPNHLDSAGPVHRGCPCSSCVAAREGARQVSDEARETGAIPGVKVTVGEWFRSFHAAKEARGTSSVAEMRGYAKNWILPGIEYTAMTAVTREDIERVVRRLDTAIIAWQEADGERGEGRLSPSAAANVWGHLTHAFDEAVRAKDETLLRVLTTSPAANVRGPEAGPDREGPILYSDEIVTLLRGRAVDPDDKDVPLYRRQVYAVAIYEMARRSELAALAAADVDLAHLTITVSKQTERKKKPAAKAKGLKKTKTRRTRTLDVEPNLLALVRWLVEHPQGKAGNLLRVPPIEDCADLLRKDLWTVGARRDALHTADATRTKMTFHCLRDTGLTHMAVRGDSPIAIQWRAGHTDFKMTQGYIDRGRVEARRIGAPLPPLPTEIFGDDGAVVSSRVPTFDGTDEASTLNSNGNVATPTGIEPVLPT